VKSKENIYALYNKPGDRGSVRAMMVSHCRHESAEGYFATLSDFYSKFDIGRSKKTDELSLSRELPNPIRINVGFLLSQQYNDY